MSKQVPHVSESFFLGLSKISLSAFLLPAFQGIRPFLAIACFVLPGCAQTSDLTQVSLEDLMNVQVTSVSKREQRTSQVAAAIFVISREDIRRSGALNIPDLLRMVPGLDVAQIDGGKWAISARGFNGQYSDMLLVLVDGRSVYNPIFAGDVFWDSQNVPLDSIERIEVIRGPGTAVWGANAINGIINIITRSASDTQGGSVAGGAGNGTTGPATVRYGGTAPGIGAYRLYAGGFQYDSLSASAGINGQDDWRLVHGGFRTDTTLSQKDSLTTEGEGFSGNAGELAVRPVFLLSQPPVPVPVALRDRYSGWNLLSRWNRILSPRSGTALQVYFARITRGDSTYAVRLNSFDIDFQHHLLWAPRQDLVWGLGYRSTSQGTDSTLYSSFTPQDRRVQLFGSFVQDEITLLPDRLRLSVGARLEHNDYTGFNLQPSARLAWTADSKNMFWGAISSADRTPASSDTSLRLNLEVLPGPMLVTLFADPNKKNEHVTAFEVGYRSSLTSKFSLDTTVFYNRYRDLTSVEPGAPHLEMNPAPVHLLLPENIGDGIHGETHGLEFFANWKVTDSWTLNPGYSFFAMHMHPFAGSEDLTTAPGLEGGTPDHQAQLRSSVSLPRNLRWNASAYFVNRLPAVSIPSYTRVDSSLIWYAGERLSITVAGQNLLHKLHPEYSGPNSSVLPSLMRRGAYAKIDWSF